MLMNRDEKIEAEKDASSKISEGYTVYKNILTLVQHLQVNVLKLINITHPIKSKQNHGELPEQSGIRRYKDSRDTLKSIAKQLSQIESIIHSSKSDYFQKTSFFERKLDSIYQQKQELTDSIHLAKISEALKNYQMEDKQHRMKTLVNVRDTITQVVAPIDKAIDAAVAALTKTSPSPPMGESAGDSTIIPDIGWKAGDGYLGGITKAGFAIPLAVSKAKVAQAEFNIVKEGLRKKGLEDQLILVSTLENSMDELQALKIWMNNLNITIDRLSDLMGVVIHLIDYELKNYTNDNNKCSAQEVFVRMHYNKIKPSILDAKQQHDAKLSGFQSTMTTVQNLQNKKLEKMIADRHFQTTLLGYVSKGFSVFLNHKLKHNVPHSETKLGRIAKEAKKKHTKSGYQYALSRTYNVNNNQRSERLALIWLYCVDFIKKHLNQEWKMFSNKIINDGNQLLRVFLGMLADFIDRVDQYAAIEDENKNAIKFVYKWYWEIAKLLLSNKHLNYKVKPKDERWILDSELIDHFILHKSAYYSFHEFAKLMYLSARERESYIISLGEHDLVLERFYELEMLPAREFFIELSSKFCYNASDLDHDFHRHVKNSFYKNTLNQNYLQETLKKLPSKSWQLVRESLTNGPHSDNNYFLFSLTKSTHEEDERWLAFYQDLLLGNEMAFKEAFAAENMEVFLNKITSFLIGRITANNNSTLHRQLLQPNFQEYINSVLKVMCRMWRSMNKCYFDTMAIFNKIEALEYNVFRLFVEKIMMTEEDVFNEIKTFLNQHLPIDLHQIHIERLEQKKKEENTGQIELIAFKDQERSSETKEKIRNKSVLSVKDMYPLIFHACQHYRDLLKKNIDAHGYSLFSPYHAKDFRYFAWAFYDVLLTSVEELINSLSAQKTEKVLSLNLHAILLLGNIYGFVRETYLRWAKIFVMTDDNQNLSNHVKKVMQFILSNKKEHGQLLKLLAKSVYLLLKEKSLPMKSRDKTNSVYYVKFGKEYQFTASNIAQHGVFFSDFVAILETIQQASDEKFVDLCQQCFTADEYSMDAISGFLNEKKFTFLSDDNDAKNDHSEMHQNTSIYQSNHRKTLIEKSFEIYNRQIINDHVAVYFCEGEGRHQIFGNTENKSYRVTYELEKLDTGESTTWTLKRKTQYQEKYDVTEIFEVAWLPEKLKNCHFKLLDLQNGDYKFDVDDIANCILKHERKVAPTLLMYSTDDTVTISIEDESQAGEANQSPPLTNTTAYCLKKLSKTPEQGKKGKADTKKILVRKTTKKDVHSTIHSVCGTKNQHTNVYQCDNVNGVRSDLKKFLENNTQNHIVKLIQNSINTQLTDKKNNNPTSLKLEQDSDSHDSYHPNNNNLDLEMYVEHIEAQRDPVDEYIDQITKDDYFFNEYDLQILAIMQKKEIHLYTDSNEHEHVEFDSNMNCQIINKLDGENKQCRKIYHDKSTKHFERIEEESWQLTRSWKEKKQENIPINNVQYLHNLMIHNVGKGHDDKIKKAIRLYHFRSGELPSIEHVSGPTNNESHNNATDMGSSYYDSQPTSAINGCAIL